MHKISSVLNIPENSVDLSIKEICDRLKTSKLNNIK